MRAFPTSFLLFFLQVAAGGIFALAATPFQDLERGFYKSTGSVLFAIALLALWGKADVYREPLNGPITFGTGIELILQVIFIVFFALYLVSLWGERVVFRARMFSLSLLTGLLALIQSSLSFHQAPLVSVETLLYAMGFVLSALLLGGVTVGMLIGHWYLIDTGQSIDPFLRVFRFFVASLVAQVVFFLIGPPLFYLFGNAETISQLKRLWQDHFILLSARVLVGQVGPLALSALIGQTLKIPHTMAATGLFYIALLGVFVGEMLGKQILSLTSLPF